MRSKRLGGLALLVGLQACASASRPVPLDVAIRIIENDLRNAAVIPLSDLNAADPERAKAVDQSIFQYQCYYGSANPVIAVMTSQFTLGLQGTFTQGGKVSVGGVGGTPTAGFEYDVSSGQQQALTVPMAFVSVSNLPSLYLSQNLAYLTGMGDAQKKTQVDALLKNESDLAAHLAPIIASFQSRRNQCAKDSNGKPILPGTVIQPQLE